MSAGDGMDGRVYADIDSGQQFDRPEPVPAPSTAIVTIEETIAVLDRVFLLLKRISER